MRVSMARIVVAACLSAWALAGCGRGGPEVLPVSGVVNLDGTPLADAAVMFSGADGKQPVTARTDSTGKFSLSARPGSNSVAVAKGTPGAAPAPGDGLMPAGKVAPPPKSAVPAKYADFRTSTLKVDVKKGMPPVSLDLSSK